MFKDKILMVTGGTGSFGNAVVKRFLDTDIKEIRIFSRDEKKQNDMRIRFNDNKLYLFPIFASIMASIGSILMLNFRHRKSKFFNLSIGILFACKFSFDLFNMSFVASTISDIE